MNTYAVWNNHKVRQEYGMECKTLDELLCLERENTSTMHSYITTDNIAMALDAIENETDVRLCHSEPIYVVVCIGDYQTFEEAARDGALHVSDWVEESKIDSVVSGVETAMKVYSSDIDFKVMSWHEYKKLVKESTK